MTLTVMDSFTVDGSPRELAEYTALIILILEQAGDQNEARRRARDFQQLFRDFLPPDLRDEDGG